MDKKKKPLPDEDEWELIPTTPDTPRQRNGKFLVGVSLYECAIVSDMSNSFLPFAEHDSQDLIVVSLPAWSQIFSPKTLLWSSVKTTSTSAENALLFQS